MPGSPDLSEFDQFDSRSRRNQCRIYAVLQQLSPEDVKKLRAAFENEISNKAILGWFNARGITDNLNSAITSHRKRTCSCD